MMQALVSLFTLTLPTFCRDARRCGGLRLVYLGLPTTPAAGAHRRQNLLGLESCRWRPAS